ncbi:hypothetical protein [Xanthomonas bundabergensis]|uniref:hypothetical protein n=1 Tax=Xanthomonas bundabergensis TaxID=3160842 RepID=UPI003519A557
MSLLLLISGCVGDAKITVSGSAKNGVACIFNRYSDGRLVETFPVAGKFKEIYAVSVLAEKDIEIVCAGVVVARERLSVTKGDIDFGELPCSSK